MLHRLPLARRRTTTQAAHRYVAVLAALGLIVVGLVAVPAAPAQAVVVGNLPVSVDAPSPILAGEDGSVTIEVRNEGADRFNLGFAVLVPVGLTPGQATAHGGATVGTPRVVTAGTLGAGEPPVGTELWVWEDVSDLPAGAASSLVVVFTPDPAQFPVGSTIAVEATAHTSTDARYRPVFPGSTGVGGSAAEAATASSPTIDAEIKVSALRLVKEQLTYAENEILRGVHEQGAVYRLRVTNTNQGQTEDDAIAKLELVDWIPAGLEFLGCGGAGVDNSTYDWSGVGGGDALEYDGAGALGAGRSAPGPCPTPESVTTVEATADDAELYDVVAGRVYTRVAWSLANLAAGETRDVHYVAAVPLRANTVDWSNAPHGEAPSAASREQGANLDNNSGPSTRHGSAASYEDGDAWTNAARAQGYYRGSVAPGTDRLVWDADTETVTAMDLAIVKSVDRHDFARGEIASYTLTVSASEYASSSDVFVMDRIPDGMCLVPTDSSTNPADCLSGTDASFGDWDVAEIIDGPGSTQVVTLTYWNKTIAPNESVTLEYPVLMGVSYDTTDWGPTTGGDGFTNTVELRATTTPIAPTDESGRWSVWDDSQAVLSAPVATISKQVLAKSALPGAGCAAADPTTGDWRTGDASDPASDFRLGDTVCYLLTVSFPGGVDTRDAVVADVLPAGIVLGGWQGSAGSPTVTQQGSSLEWLVGETVPGTSDRIVPRGATLHLYVWGIVTPAAVGAVVDKPENLMKYRQENVTGEVFFLRDEAAVEIVPPPLGLRKGVRDVDGQTARPAQTQTANNGATFGSNRDGIYVVEDEVITYRVDLTSDFPVHDVVVWDLLPAVLNPLDQVEVDALLDVPAGVDVVKAATLGISGADGSRWALVWDGIAVGTAAGDSYRETLEYSLRVTPEMAEVETAHTNTASVISYAADTNDGGERTYYPAGGPSYAGRPPTADRVPAQPGRTTTDLSQVRVEDVDVTKAVSSPVGNNNAGPALPASAGNTQVAIGEWATYTYDVTIPANTTVVAGLLRDILPTAGNWQVDADETRVIYPSGEWDAATAGGVTTFTHAGRQFTVAPASGQLSFPTGVYTTADEETFTVELTARVRPAAAWVHGPSVNRTNTAEFRSSGLLKDSATASTRIVEPDPSISKVAGDDTIVAEQLVTYTLQAWNPSGRPTSFDTVVVDCVPAGLAVQTPITAPTGTTVAVDTAAAECSGTLITWTVGDLAAEFIASPGGGEIPSRQSLSYDVVIDPAAGAGVRYENTARITGYSVPDDRPDTSLPDPRRSHSRTATERITAINPTIVKTVESGASTTAVIGEVVDYEVVVTIPVDINLYDPTIVDAVPAGIAVSDVDVAYGLTWATPPSATPSLSGQTITLDLGDVHSADDVRTVTLTYRGTVVDDTATADDGSTLENTATLAWNGVDGDGATRATLDDDATVTVREPAVTIDKLVDHRGTTPAAQSTIDVDAGGAFHYRVRVANMGTSTAHDVEVVDEVPAGVVVDAGSISAGGSLTGADPTLGGGTITWSLATLVSGAANAVTLTYEGSLASSGLLDGTARVNEVEVTEYFSHPGGTGFDDDERRRYTGPDDDASVTPLFPVLETTKTAGPGLAYIEQEHPFTIVLRNTGDSPARNVVISDELPAGWAYVPGSALIEGVALAPTVSGSLATGHDLRWEPSGQLPSGAQVTLTYDAVPVASHTWTTANTGSAFAHVNSVEVSGEDLSGSDHRGTPSGDPEYYADDDDASVRLHRADLVIDKAHTGDIVAGRSLTWTIDVSNASGSDPAVGDIVVTDTLPANVELDSAAGTGWTVVGPDADGVLTLTHPGPIAAGAALPTITVVVDVPADLDAGGAVTNEVKVEGRTFETELGNNTDSDSGGAVTIADLEIFKAASQSSYTPGEDITWTIDVTNHGPSVSRTPFTVVDTLPTAIDPATLELVSGAGWAIDETDGFEVTFGYSGTDLGVDGDTTTLTFRAEVWPHWSATTTIANTATVFPRTPEPSDAPANNTDDVAIGSGSASADLVLVKELDSDDLVAGGQGRYRLTVTNDGPSDAIDVVVTDTLPAGITYAGELESATGDTWELDGAPVDNLDGTQTVTFRLDSNAAVLPDEGVTWFAFDVDVDSSLTATVTNVAVVDATTPDPNSSNNEDEEPSTPFVETNLSVTKVHDDAVRRVGDSVVFTVEVTNHGLADAVDVEIVDALPAGLTFSGLSDVLEATDGRTWTHAVVDDELTASLDDPLPAGETAVVEVTAVLTPASFPSVTNTVSVTTTTEETDPDDNEATDPVQVDSPDLRVVKTAADESVQGGDELTYTIVVTNHGGAHADAVTLTDSLPAELEHLTSTWDSTDPAHAVGDACELTGADAEGLGGTLECELPDGLAAGQSATLLVTLAVPADVAVDTVTNAVSVASDDEDPSLRGDNDDEETVTVRWMSVAAHPACVLEAPWLGFDVDLHNVAVGSSLDLEWFADVDADGVPDGAAIHTATVAVSTGEEISGRVLWPGAEVDDDGVAVVLPGYRPAKHGEEATWQGLVEDRSLAEHALRGDVLLRFSINPEQWVSTSYPDASSDCLAVRDTVLEISKLADAERVDAGDELTYEIEVRNTGDGAARDVVVTDRVPEQLKVTGVRTAEPSSTEVMPWAECTLADEDDRGYGGTVSCALDGVLARGQVAPLITIVTTVDPDAESGDVVNVAEVEWTSADGDEEDGTAEDDAEVEVRAEDDLAVTGAELFRAVGLAVVLVLLGAILVLAVRARRA